MTFISGKRWSLTNYLSHVFYSKRCYIFYNKKMRKTNHNKITLVTLHNTLTALFALTINVSETCLSTNDGRYESFQFMMLTYACTNIAQSFCLLSSIPQPHWYLSVCSVIKTADMLLTTYSCPSFHDNFFAKCLLFKARA
jgi:hypothetical protein